MEKLICLIVRLDGHHAEHVELILEKYLSGWFIWCKENSKSNDNPHIHLQFQTRCKSQAVRKAIIALGYKGNGSYSLKSPKQSDPDPLWPLAHVAYCVKDGDYYTNLNKDQVDKALKDNQDTVDAYKANIKDDKKNRSFDEIEKFWLAHPDCNQGYGCHDAGIVMKAVISYYLSKDMQIRRSAVEAATFTLLCKHHNGAEQLANSWSKFI